VILSRS
jgi:hypothetical protein